MPFRDGRAVRSWLATHPSRQSIADAHALRTLVFTATFSPDYVADTRWASAVVPSRVGRDLLKHVSTLPIPKPDLHLALLGLFWYEDLLIDAATSDLATMRATIEDEVARARFYWPKIQGRYLYDHYSKTFDADRDSITGSDIQRLLHSTPVGVYQAGNVVTGPLGLVESQVVRHFPPQMALGLWHCPMLDCGALHGVKIVPAPIPLVEAFAQLKKVAVQLWPTTSRWERVLDAWSYEADDAWRTYSDMPLFIGDCLVGSERGKLLSRALASPHGDALRRVLEVKAPSKTRGASETVANNLNEDEQLQLLLTLSDTSLTNLIDELVWSGQVTVPVAEVREIDRTKRTILSDTPSMRRQLSNLGVRSQRHSPILTIRHLLLRAHADENDVLELNWRLRKGPSESTENALMAYLRRTHLANTIDALILSSPRVTNEIATALETTIDMADEHARNVIAWKLGFNLPREDRQLAAVQQLWDVFHETLSRITTPKRDEDRQAIRAAGVNAFVELEGLLDELVAYVVWILQSDHPKETHFIYSRAAATKRVAEALGEELRSGNESVRWSTAGNTLGTSLRYLQRLNTWITALPSTDRMILRRSEDEVHELSSDNPMLFPFRYVRLWADASPDGLARLGGAIAKCADILDRVDVPGIRNGLEHYRSSDKFPSVERLFEVVLAVQPFVALVTKERLIPNFFWLSGESTDAFGQNTIRLVDFKNDSHYLHTPRTVNGLLSWRSISASRPLLVAPANLFDLPNADIVFLVRQDSEYSRYWEKYPTRREEVLVMSKDDGGRGVPSIE